MCKLDEKFILCSCDDKELKNKNYWELYRFDEAQPFLVGFTNPRFFHGEFKFISDFIHHELNTRNCFDSDINVTNHDVLVVVIIGDPPATKEHFAFSFLDGKWGKEDYDMMHISHKYVKKEVGTIR